MATTKLSNSGTTGAKYPTASAANNYMETIASTLVGAGGVSSITFSNIPQGYKHLQLRANVLTTSAGGGVYAQFNSDTGANYTRHYILGTGAAASSAAATAISNLEFFGESTGTSITQPSVVIVDILEYTNTNKYKTTRSLSGVDKNGSGEIEIISGLWLNTSAITSILLFPSGPNYAQYSRFSLYGIKG